MPHRDAIGPVQRLSRLSLQELDVRGQSIPAGQRIHLIIGAANRDPRQFERPDEFDIREFADEFEYMVQNKGRSIVESTREAAA